MSERLLQQEIAPVLECVDLSRVFGRVRTLSRCCAGYRSGSVPASASPSLAHRARARARCCTCSGAGRAELRGGKADGAGLGKVRDAERGRLRNECLGFVYQFHHLLPEFSALENVAMPLYIRRMPRLEADAKARRCSRRWGLAIVSITRRESSRAASASERRSRVRW